MAAHTIGSYINMLNAAGLLIEANVINENTDVSQITYNSKLATPNSLFTCKGAAFKPTYLDEAVQNGSSFYMSEIKYRTDVDCIIVNDVRKAMALIACLYSNYAFDKLNLIGITGTKGKSTCCYYIKYIIDEFCQAMLKKPSGIVSSIDVYDGKIKKESHLTTPEAFELHEHFANAVQSGIDFFEMEVSSQALKYDRVLGVTFDVGVFLNISEDHISPVEHSDFDDYLNAKLKLFSQSTISIVNLDTDYRDSVMSSATSMCEKVLTFAIESDADYCGYDVKKVGGEIRFCVKSSHFDEQFCLTMPGLFNVENALAAVAVCDHFKIPLEYIKAGLAKARSSGRMEIFACADNNTIAIVDYAHNKLSFTKLYQSIILEYPDYDIVTVFGCPGGKALNRRHELGELAGKYSSKVYLTAEDPGYEEVADISADIAQYVTCECYKIDERSEAIDAAINEATGKTIILVTGKGNETRQKIKSEYVPCETDINIVKHAILQKNGETAAYAIL